MTYCTKEEVRLSAQGMTTSAVPAATDTLVDALIERVSRLFDNEVGVEEGFFEAAGVSATSKTIYGSGTNFLRLPAYVADSLNTSLTYPDGYASLPFLEKDGYLIRVSDLGTLLFNAAGSPWYEGVPIVISARWGFSATPADVKLAIIEWVINIWRETDPAGLKLINIDNQPLREDIPPRVAEVARIWRVKSNPVFI